MNDGLLTVWIGEREALPVRAIPYVTGWAVSPDQIAKDLSQPLSKDSSRLSRLIAYHLVGGVPTVVAAREWDAIVVKLKAFEATLKNQFPDHDSGYAAWRTTAAEQLPKNAFIWLDEFTAQFSGWREEQEFSVQRPGDNELILAPMLDEQIMVMVLEGFAPRDIVNGQLSIDSEATSNSGNNEGDVGHPRIVDADGTWLFDGAPADTDEEPETIAPYLTTTELVDHFLGFMGVANPSKVLSEYPAWATKNQALVNRGRRGKPSKTRPDSSEWDPVQFALNLLGKDPTPILYGTGKLQWHDLDKLFGRKLLQPWKQEWDKKKPVW